jgi:hypothetical protein
MAAGATYPRATLARRNEQVADLLATVRFFRSGQFIADTTEADRLVGSMPHTGGSDPALGGVISAGTPLVR